MPLPRHLRATLATAMAILSVGCGGGGGDDGAVTTSTPLPAAQAPAPAAADALTYDGQTLSGRLMVPNSLGQFDLYDLATGASRVLGDYDADVWWEAGRSPDTVVRYDMNVVSGPKVRVTLIDTTTWAPKGLELLIPPRISSPKLSADGKYLLAMWGDAATDAERYNNPMTFIEVSTGRVVKRDWTLIKDEFTGIIGAPADWLPDNGYVFLDGRKLYRATLGAAAPTLVATLSLEDNLSTGGAGSDFVDLTASPDGRRIAFTWNGHIWVAGVDGSNLHRVTALAPDDTFGPAFGSPAWSPDSQWLAGVLNRGGTNVAPVFPGSGDIAPPYQVIGTSGCASPVFVVRADGPAATVTWPRWPVEAGVRARNAKGQLIGVSTCDGQVFWIP